MSNAATAPTPTRARRAPMTAPAAPEPAPEAPAAAAEPEGTRSARKPFGVRSQRLENNTIPGFQCYWFNDFPGRIDRAKEAGYEHVLDSNGKPVQKVVGVAEGGGGLRAYRMKIPLEFYLADQAAKEAPRAEIDASMRSARDRDAGYAAPGAPAFDRSPSDGRAPPVASAQMSAEGRQRFNLPKAE